MADFKLSSSYKPSGDQPKAIASLVEGLNDGLRDQVLLGVTGSGKTFTIANVIEQVNKPTLVIAHNKTLAGQLYNEFKEFFPNNRVEYFVSYYDYYQPEAYIPSKDLYIEKDLAINEEIDKLRHSATSALCERKDVIVVSSVSCIYGLGAPMEYFAMAVSLRKGMQIDRDTLIERLVDIQYNRASLDLDRGTFRARGDVIEIMPIYHSDIGIRIEFFGDEIDRIVEFDPLTAKALNTLEHTNIFPASHYVVGKENREEILKIIGGDMIKQTEQFLAENKFIEAQRIKERVSYDIESISEMGYCSGVENYSRYFDGRQIGQSPYTLIDFFGDDFLMVIDESHITVPQVGAMFSGDLSRKTNLVNFGFRLPSAYDNRPLKFAEFDSKICQAIYVSATPSQYELQKAGNITEQIIRPTGLIDPIVEVRTIEGQIDDLMSEINKITALNERVLVTTLTKKMAESLTAYLKEHNIKVEYMHSDIDTLERMEIIKKLRLGVIDVIVGINLLREGIDMPEVRLVAILDADKEGFLRSETALIQTIGRAARNSNGRVVMYADKITKSMDRAIKETERRRILQKEHNIANNITPTTIKKEILNKLEITKKIEEKLEVAENIDEQIRRYTSAMKLSSANLDFENAIKYREMVAELKIKKEKIEKKKKK